MCRWAGVSHVRAPGVSECADPVDASSGFGRAGQARSRRVDHLTDRSRVALGRCGRLKGGALCCRSVLVLGIILFGMLIGAAAQLIVGRSGRGINWPMALASGLIGSFVGGLLGSLLSGDGLALRPSGIIGSLIGAILVTLVWHWWTGRPLPGIPRNRERGPRAPPSSPGPGDPDSASLRWLKLVVEVQSWKLSGGSSVVEAQWWKPARAGPAVVAEPEFRSVVTCARSFKKSAARSREKPLRQTTRSTARSSRFSGKVYAGTCQPRSRSRREPRRRPSR